MLDKYNLQCFLRTTTAVVRAQAVSDMQITQSQLVLLLLDTNRQQLRSCS
jgi:hypothetical protein